MIQPIHNFRQTDEYFDKKNPTFPFGLKKWGIADKHERMSIFSTDKCNKKLEQKSLLRQQQVSLVNQKLGYKNIYSVVNNEIDNIHMILYNAIKSKLLKTCWLGKEQLISNQQDYH